VFVSAIDVLIVGMNPQEHNGSGTVTVGGADLRLWEVAHRMPESRTDLLTDTTSIITFRRPDRTKDRLGSLCRRSGTKTVSWQIITAINPIETNRLNKGTYRQ